MEGGKQYKLKLQFHQKNRFPEELLVNVKGLGPNINEGDIIEIYHPEDDGKQQRLLLQVPVYDEHFTPPAKDSISVEQNIASIFQLRAFSDVIVNKVDPDDVSLELLELTFKDQYLSRSDMWKIKRNLANKVVVLSKKIEYCKGIMYCQAYEMWTKGEKVSCGLVNEDTKIVFRSSTCQAYLFIQMSSEMWEFDIHGDLYFEKAVNGFLADLFMKWKEEGSNHDVTIVLFSRTYYKATDIDEFPKHMRDCLQEDYQGKFYEDFYRVAVQNERYDDWMPIVNHLRNLFHNYLSDVLEYHKISPDMHIPEAFNSNAPQGNFLEVLNISLNVFEKHFEDRSFDRTGQMSVVITAGVGVFEVDRELTNITKQRIIDNGVGSDLVCVGEQPLHAVPLLKFHKKKGTFQADDYSMPHTWINLSFYSSDKKLAHGTFIPRIKVPSEVLKSVAERGFSCPPLPSIKSTHEDHHSLLNSVFDYDAYDAQVFKLPANQNNRANRSLQRTPARKKATSQSCSQPPPRISFPHTLSDPDLYRSAESSSNVAGMIGSVGALIAKSPAINIPSKIPEHSSGLKSFGALNLEGGKYALHPDLEDLSPSCKSKFGSSGTNSPNEALHHAFGKISNMMTGRSLINPFDPSHVTIKRTSNRRRWIHIFPKGPTGVLFQQHHYKVSSSHFPDDEDDLGQLSLHKNKISSSDPKARSYSSRDEAQDMKHATLLWGATGEQEWNAEITTGVDWKSLTLPACLPLTTDYFPDKQSLNNGYVVAGNYALLPDPDSSTGKKAITTYEVFLEIVSQRLAQGFQLIVRSSDPRIQGTESNFLQIRRPSSRLVAKYKLSIGRVFHRVQFSDSQIDVTIYRPKYPYPQLKRCYKYRFCSPLLSKYEMSLAEFRTERLENYKWNYLDNYICLRGDPIEYPLLKELKYWRFRVLMLPDLYRNETKTLMEQPFTSHCDIFHTMTYKEKQATVENFLKFLEFIHKIKKSNTKKTWNPSSTGRERLGSNHMAERPRLHSGSKAATERIRAECALKDDATGPLRMGDKFEEEYKDEGDLKKLSIKSELSDIVKAMMDPNDGVPFIIAPDYFLPFTFIAYDACYWVLKHIEEITDELMAVKFLERLQIQEFIRHIHKGVEFINGFIFYTFTMEGTLDERYFENDFLEIPMDIPAKLDNLSANNSVFSSAPHSAFTNDVPTTKEAWASFYSSSVMLIRGLYKSSFIDIDVSNKSDRFEWAHLKYMSHYCPLEGYEIIFRWLCASGPLINDSMMMWQRKACHWALRLFPIPSDPFAFPLSYSANPLRGLLFVPLDTSCLVSSTGCDDPFGEFPEETRSTRMYLFQEFILLKFGFFRYMSETDDALQYQFIHATGVMFVQIKACEVVSSMPVGLSKNRLKVWVSPSASLKQPGFLWSFNYMLSRRKSQGYGDEMLGEKILQDFKSFCCNENDRLRTYWLSLQSNVDNLVSPSQPFVDVYLQ